MSWDRQLLWNTVAPSVLAGAVVVLIALSLGGGWLLVISVLVASLAGGAGCAWRVQREQREALARLRHPDLNVDRAGGLFGGIVRAAGELLQQRQREAEQAGSAKAELEISAKLQKKETRRLKAAFSVLDDALLICDSRDELLFANSAVRTLQLLPSDSLSDSGATVRVQQFRDPAIGQLIRETRQRHAASPRRTTELDLPIGDQTIPYRMTVTVLSDANGDVLGTASVLTDIRDERSAKTRHAEFVSSVAHEFKTPMASIKAFLELLLDGDVEDPAEQKEFFERIDSQVERLNRLVSNLLNLARIESGAIKVQRADCDLNDVLQKAGDVIQPLAEEKQQTFVAELSQLYLPVHVDRDLLGQAIINLLSNAVKYTPTGGRIALRSHMDELEAIIEVTDNGLGIPPESLPKIFDRFYRVPEHTQAAAGTGLGLAFVQSIVEDLHNGHIDATSTVNAGSTFTARIPLGHHDAKRGYKKPEPALATA